MKKNIGITTCNFWRVVIPKKIRIMKKLSILFVMLFGLVLVSCVSNNVEPVEKTITAPLFSKSFANESTVITENARLRKMFDKFNKLYFNNYLKVDYIGYVPEKDLAVSEYAVEKEGYEPGYFGGFSCKFYYNGQYTVIGIADSITNETDLGSILLHEMIHVLFFMRDDFAENHGPNFQYKVNRINELSHNRYKVR